MTQRRRAARILVVTGLFATVAGCSLVRPPAPTTAVGSADQYVGGQVVDTHGLLLVVNGDAAQRTFRAFSPTDPRSGCRVHWEAERALFVDPCLGSLYKRDGTPFAGPSARPLQELQVRVRDGVVEVTTPT